MSFGKSILISYFTSPQIIVLERPNFKIDKGIVININVSDPIEEGGSWNNDNKYEKKGENGEIHLIMMFHPGEIKSRIIYRSEQIPICLDFYELITITICSNLVNDKLISFTIFNGETTLSKLSPWVIILTNLISMYLVG